MKPPPGVARMDHLIVALDLSDVTLRGRYTGGGLCQLLLFVELIAATITYMRPVVGLWLVQIGCLGFIALMHPPRPQVLNIDRLRRLVVGRWCAVHGSFASGLIVDTHVHYMA